jgi:hypothetical protein
MTDIRILSNSAQPFADRAEAGRLLGEALRPLKLKQPVVLGIPRGGIVTAAIVARAVQGQMDIVLTRKLRAPSNPELAIGAVTESGQVFLDDNLVSSLASAGAIWNRKRLSRWPKSGAAPHSSAGRCPTCLSPDERWSSPTTV